VQMYLEPRADHTNGIKNPWLPVKNELPWQQVQNLPVGRPFY